MRRQEPSPAAYWECIDLLKRFKMSHLALAQAEAQR